MAEKTAADNAFTHYSVLLRESIDALQIYPDGVYCDLTLGGGGHSEAIASRLGTGGRLIATDRDADAIAASKKRLAPYEDKITFYQSNFCHIDTVLSALGVEKIDGAVIDLGVSSYQLDCAERGFSYMQDAPLDMRMDQRESLDARTVVNTYSADELARILFTYGEEKFSRRIAERIVSEREKAPIETTLQLSELVKDAIPVKARVGGHHPAKRTFQAIRIEVNGELSVIEPTLRTLIGCLKPGGRLSVITFHSLEDRIVKKTFADASSGCTCPPGFPVCVCGKKPAGRAVTKKPILPSERELLENPRSRSAKLRVFEKGGADIE